MFAYAPDPTPDRVAAAIAEAGGRPFIVHVDEGARRESDPGDPMIDATQIRKNMILKMDDGQLWRVVDMQLITPGRWKAMVQTKLRSLKDNSVKDHRFRSVDRVEQIHLDDVEMEFLYQNGDEYVFMNHETYDQVQLTAEAIGDSRITSSPTSSSPSRASTASRSTSSPPTHGSDGHRDRAVHARAPPRRLLQTRRSWKTGSRSSSRRSSCPGKRSRSTPARTSTSSG